MSKYTTYVQNWVFKHYTWKTFGNNRIKGMLDYINTSQDWRRKHSISKKCLKNLELVKNSHEKYDVKTTSGLYDRRNYEGIGQTWNPTTPGHLKDSNQFARYTSETLQLPSAVQPDLTRYFVIQAMRSGMTLLEAKIESQKAVKVFKEIKKQHMTLWTIGMKSTSIRFKVSVLMTVLAHRYHQQAE